MNNCIHIQDSYQGKRKMKPNLDNTLQYSFKKQFKQTYTPHSKNSTNSRQNFGSYDSRNNRHHFNFNNFENQSQQKKQQQQQKVDLNRYMKEYQYNANVNLYNGQKNGESGKKKTALKQWFYNPIHNKKKSSSMAKAFQYPLQEQQNIPSYQKKDLFIYSPQFSTFSNQYQKYSQGKIVKQLLQQNRLLKLELSEKNQRIVILQAELLHINNEFEQKLTYFMRNSDKKQLQIDELSEKIKVYENYIQEFKNAQIQRNLELKQLLDKNFELSNRIIEIKANYIIKDELLSLVKINNSELSSNKKVAQLSNTTIVKLLTDSITQKQKLQELVLNIWKMKSKIQQTTNRSNPNEQNSNKKNSNFVMDFNLEKDLCCYSIDNLKILWSWIKKIGHQYSRLKKFTDDQNELQKQI